MELLENSVTMSRIHRPHNVTSNQKEATLVRKLLYLATAALLAMLILVPVAIAQGTTQGKMEQTTKTQKTQPLPSSGGPGISSVLLPATALLVGSGALSYAVLRRKG
jgi:hypothetical protein